MVSNRDIIALQHISGCGDSSIRIICDYIHYNEFNFNWETDLPELLSLLKNKGIIARRIPEISNSEVLYLYEKADRILTESLSFGIKSFSIYDAIYPTTLHHTVDENGKRCPPLILYYKGDINAIKKTGVAIIGTREPDPRGIAAARFVSGFFANNGFNIISGLAIGCDTLAHQSALDKNGTTTAILAGGLDTVYPPQNESLLQAILDHNGLVLSEYPIHTKTSRYNLVARDRLQAGFANATILIQTSASGGAMHASLSTIKAGKPLYAIQYKDMSSNTVNGNVKLLSIGAEPLVSNKLDSILTDIVSASIITESKEPSLF